MKFGRYLFIPPASQGHGGGHKATVKRSILLILTLLSLIVMLSAVCTQVVAQSLVTGDIAGTVTDPSGAVIPNAKITLKSLDTGATQSTSTTSTGSYRLGLIKPGRYMITAAETGFQEAQRPIEVAVGQVAQADLKLEVGSSTQTVEVSAEAPLLSTEEASMNTYFTPTELSELPSPGGDITNIAFTAPGAVVNATGGYGNFTVNGLPATSNLFTVNGENDMDPYFNINNSGATNLTIGQNELQEATVVTNAYDGQYGQLSGAQVVYVTKSGSNAFHGNVEYWWNGRAMNSNDFFNNATDTPRPFSNANQWADAVGGPIHKNTTFFFFDNEGIRFVLPNVIATTIPTPAFASAVEANVSKLQPNEAATYQKLFNLYENAPGAANASALPNSSACNNLTLPGFDPSTQACAETFEATPSALAKEWVLAFRVDQKLSNNDNLYFRYKGDHGLQPTHLDPISPNFDALSNQPSWDSQLDETHIFGPRATNDFKATLSHYVAQFAQNAQLANSTFPYSVINSGAVPFSTVNRTYEFPQGRNITQYQFIDDYTLSLGAHSLKFGANFRRYDVSDHNFFFNSPTVYFGYTDNGLQNYADGVAFQYRENDNLASDVPVAMWGLGMYAQDQWKVRPNLTLTLALRAERNSNPVCQTNCFANFKGEWTSLASVTSSNPGSVPYSSDISYNQHQAFPGVDAIDIGPRVGFSWSPFSNSKTVFSGGFGIFYDSPAEGLLDNMLSNPPVSVAIRVRPATGVLGFDPAGGAATWQASANAFNVTENYTQIATALQSLGAIFAAPAVNSFAGTIHAPKWYEWNFQVQHQFSGSTALFVNYVGNHGNNIPYGNSWPNAFDEYGVFTGVSSVAQAPAVPNYGEVTQFQSGAISNYDGLQVTFRKQFSHWVTAHANYTWSHNLDETSNGGVFTYGDSQTQSQINPTSLRANNYGNSDYDIRHLVSVDFVVEPKYHGGNKFMSGALNGWTWSGKLYYHTGLPFSVTDDNWGYGNGGGLLMATPVGGSGQTSCGVGATYVTGTPCLNASAFLNSGSASFTGYTYFSPQTRNQYRGPGFFDVDSALFKGFHLGSESRTMSIGIQAFNAFNHPNFANPDSGVGDALFGLITGTLNAPTSPYGNFLGFDSSVRVVQLTGKIVF